MTNEYYYFISGLPEIHFDHAKTLPNRVELFWEALDQVEAEDRAAIRIIRYPIDNKNLCARLEKRDVPFIDGGNFTQDHLDRGLKDPDLLPSYMSDFIQNHAEQKRDFPQLNVFEDELTWIFFEFAAQFVHPFIRDWFCFDLDIRNILAGLNCRQYKRPCSSMIIGDNDVAEAVLKSQAADFGLIPIFPLAEKICELYKDNPLALEIGVDQIRWNKLEDIPSSSFFRIESLLAYFLKLDMVSRRQGLTTERGQERIDTLTDELKKSFQFSESFHHAGGTQ